MQVKRLYLMHIFLQKTCNYIVVKMKIIYIYMT